MDTNNEAFRKLVKYENRLRRCSNCTECKVAINLFCLSALFAKTWKDVNVGDLKCKVEPSETEFRPVFLISVSINFPFTSTPGPDGCEPGVGETRQLSQN